MARFLTTKIQLSAHRMTIRRIEQAFLRRDVYSETSPFSPQATAYTTGCIFGALAIGMGLLLSFLMPRADQRTADIIITNSGGRYVMYGEQLHAVFNLASARLISGKPDVAKIVKDAALDKRPRGLPMGIPSAPDNLTQRMDDTATWVVCDQHTDASTLSLVHDSDLTTTVFAGEETLTDSVVRQPSNEAMLVKQVKQPNRLWIVYMDRKAEIYPEDQATRHALGITPDAENKAIKISQGLMDAIAPAPALTTPYIPDRGVVNPMLPSVKTGDVIVTRDSSGERVYHVALTGGVERINEFLAQLLENTGSTVITDIASDKLSSLPKLSEIDISRYPDRAPTFTRPHVLCWKWSRGATDLSANVQVMTGEALPVDSQYQPVILNPSTGSIVQATHSVMAPGKGWFVQVVGDSPQSQAREQWMWIDDTGIRYFIGGSGDDHEKPGGDRNKTIEMLGVNHHAPQYIPWNIGKLFAQGSTLSRENALTTHENVITDIHQQSVPDHEKQEQVQTAVS